LTSGTASNSKASAHQKTITRMKIQLTELGKSLQLFIKGLMSRIYKELKKSKPNNPITKWANEPVVLKEVQMANKHRKKGSTSLAKKAMQIETLRSRLTPASGTIHKKTNNKWGARWGSQAGKEILTLPW
jgi:hypothetical protein